MNADSKHTSDQINAWLAATTRSALFTRGAILVVLGILLIFWPDVVTRVLTIGVGAAMLIYAGIIVTGAFRVKGLHCGLMFTFAALLVVFGVWGVARPDGFVNFWVILLGIWSLFTGVTGLIKIFSESTGPRTFQLVAASTSIVMGILLVLFPFVVVNALFVAVGILLLVYAAIDFTCASKIK